MDVGRDVREPPRTARGLRTRATLVAAARRVFERKGYLDAKLTDITREAQCAVGSFYTYFTNKEEIFAAVLEEAKGSIMRVKAAAASAAAAAAVAPALAEPEAATVAAEPGV